MKLESFKSKLFDNKIEKPETITGGKIASYTELTTICTQPDGSTCGSYDGKD